MKASTRSPRGVADKRAALLDAALELFGRDGLQSVPTSAIAREAGVAKGTLFVYFETKEQLLNELYLEVVARQIAAITADLNLEAPPERRFRAYWFAFARWYLDHGYAAAFMLQCEASSVLTEATQARKTAMEVEMVKRFFPGAAERLERSLNRHVAYALIAGPIQVLTQARDKGAVEITDELLEETFSHIKKALLP